MMYDRSPSDISPTSAFEQSDRLPEPIAIIGIGCRFPGGVSSPEGFWKNLIAGVDAIADVPSDRWNLQSFYDPEPGKPGKSHTCRGGFIEGIDRFDPHFFGISPREAARMDPQQRLLLEVSWEALEDGGQDATRLAGSRVSVFVGISSWDFSVLQSGFHDRGNIDAYMNTGGSLSIAANRISYCFDFRGPSVAVDTACSSALVAVHLACQSIWSENAPLALAGGVNALLTPDSYIGFSRMGMLSPDGRCKAFDARANGFVRGEGAGVVVLKPLTRARADGDRIYALIRGSAINQDGRSEGMTVPNKDSQISLLRAAYRNAGVRPAEVHYIEAHGTGTPVGDPIEAGAIGAVVGEGRPSERPCIIGSVKTQIGHLEAGSGVAGLIKAALAMHHRCIPANLHFESPNPSIDFDRLRLHVPTTAEPWPAASGPQLAGVNSFGYGGTNAHIVLQGAPNPAEMMISSAEPSSVIVPLSARSQEALRAAAGDFAEFVKASPETDSLGEIAVNSANRRAHHTHRLAVVAHSKQELAESLTKLADGKPAALAATGRTQSGQTPRIAFVCPGQGPQWWGMGRQLLREEAVFRGMIERVDAIIRSLGSWSLIEELSRDEAKSRINETAISQPSIFAIQLALAALWESWGVRPEAVIGHSVGEVAATYLAGIFDLEDAARIIYHRGRCMDRASSRGRMLAIGLGEEEAKRLIAGFGQRVSIAAINAPHSTTLSGEAGPLEEIARKLEVRNVFARFLQVQYAFHSAQMDPVRAELIASLTGIRPQTARLPFFSTVTTARTREPVQLLRCSATCTSNRMDGEGLGPDYWWRNVRQTVRFAEGVNELIAFGCDTVVELSPHPVLTAAVAECFQERGKACLSLPSLRRFEDERATMLRSAAELHVRGRELNWRALHPGSRRFLRLPTYPWQRQRYWAESEESLATRLVAPVHSLLGLATGKPMPGWEARLDLKLFPDLADHRVQGVVILPATAYLECSLAVARDQFDSLECELEEVKLLSPCFPPDDGALWLHTSYFPEDSHVHVASRPTGAEHSHWTNHFRATVRPLTAPSTSTSINLDGLRNSLPHACRQSECYDTFAKLGLNYGPRFQCITRAWQGAREALAEVTLPEGLATAGDFIIHPALLDSCCQAVIVADPDFGDCTNELYLPVEIERLRLYRKPGTRLWAHARLREKTELRLIADIDVYDDLGRLLLSIEGLRSQRVAAAAGQSLDELLYAYQWIEQPLPKRSASGEPSGKKSRWLIFADRGGIGDEMAGRLQNEGDECVLVLAGACFLPISQNYWRINPACKDDMQRLLDSLQEESPLPVRGIMHLWSLDAPASDALLTGDIQAMQDSQLLSVLHLVQTWKQPAKESPRLFLVTRGAQAVASEDQVQIVQSSLIGFGRVVLNESASFRCKLIDLPAVPHSIGHDLLLKELLAEDDEDEVAIRGSKRFVHRFAPTRGNGPVIESGLSGIPYRLVSTQPGTIDGLALQAMQRKLPGPGMIEIEVRAAGLNFSDVMKSLGLYPGQPEGPARMGAECSGVIAAIGEGVPGWNIGDEVIAVAPFAFASHVVTRAQFIARKPAPMSFEAAATIPIAFLTAAYALDHLARLDTGERVLIHSATGGVGLAAIQHAQRVGAEVFATAGSEEKRQFLRERGIQHVMDSRTFAFADEVRSLTDGRGVDVILNSLAGEAIAKGIASLAEYGRFLEIGKRDIYQNTRIGLLPFQKNLSFFAIDLDRIMRERPAFLGQLLRQIVENFQAGKLEPLPYRVFPVSEAAAAFRYMQRSKHIGKVIVSMAEHPEKVAPGEDPVQFHADASYLVAGGLGGFGLATARWLVQRGAKNLILVGRSGRTTQDSRRVIEEMESTGVRVLVMQADIASEADLKRLLAVITHELPPLRGIFHAAMVLEDCLLENLDRERLHRVLAPKVQGAWNLHQQTIHLPLDHFVLFSSLSSVFGHAGQANYAAANAFLDGLAWYRRSRGLPCLTVNWGRLGEVGYLAQRRELSERLTRQGVLPFSVAEAITLLERALQRQAVQVSVMRVDWSRWTGLNVTGRISPRFSNLIEQASTPREEPTLGTSPRARLQQCPVEERQSLLGSLLRDKLARVLGARPDTTDWESPLLQLGLDSLMAVEMVNWIQAELGITLPVVELMRSPGVSSLSKLLLDRLGGREQSAQELPLPEDSSEGDDFPVSHGQRALGFLYDLDPSSPALNLSFCSRINSAIDPGSFRQAFQSLLDRHPALRTTFTKRQGELRQRIHTHSEVALEFIDASSWSEDELRSRLNEEAARPFNLEIGPLLRLFLFTRSPKDHIFLFTAHHVIGDFWSLVVLMEEMRVLYPAALAGEAPALSPAASDYRQFVRWQNERLAGAQGERLWQWWAHNLDGAPRVLDLPTDRPRPTRFTHRGGSVWCGLDAELTTRMKGLAAREGTTLFTALLAGFQVLLGKITGQDDFVVGSPFAGRPRQEFEGVVGYFINMLPLRARLGADPSFRELLQDVQGAVFDAFEYQDYPFSLIVDRLEIDRDLSRTPLIQASFTVEKAHRRGEAGASRFLLPQSQFRMEIGGLETEPFPIEQRFCQADLEMVLEENDGRIEGMLCYNIDLFETRTAERFAALYGEILNGLVARPDTPLSQIPGVTAGERQLVLEEWNGTPGEFGEPVCIHELFEKQASATPRAIAVRQQERTVTYAELDRWADRIARDLGQRGIRAGTLVAVRLERSPELIAAILGVLKAGAAYVPIDPESPHLRLRYILEETGSPIVVANSKWHNRRGQLDIPVMTVDDEGSSASTEEDTRTGHSTPASLAYVIYTSGSTGRPKGVMVDHAAVCNTVRWRLQALPTGPKDRVLLSLPAHFDASVAVIFPALASGAELVLARPREERNPTALLSRIARDRITQVQCLPSTLQSLLEEPGFASASATVSRFCCGGEPMPVPLPRRLLAQHGAELFNLYGPTETAVEATAWKCRDGGEDSRAPIGKPIANARVYVLDRHLQPLSIGIPGELFIGGAGVARGYLGDDELTAGRFLADPFSAVPGGRMFRTGDRVRWRADGALEFLGRLDRQIKVNGCRIEPAEIESALLNHPAIEDAVVAVKEGNHGIAHITAYLVQSNSETIPSRECLRDFLLRSLPRPMLPTHFVPLPTIPRTASGKVDLRALSRLEGGPAEAGDLDVSPRDRFEAFLAEVWSDVLGGENIAVTDHFFERGGNSLQALMMISRVRERLGVSVAAATVFDTPTLADFARRLRSDHAEAVVRLFGAQEVLELVNHRTSRTDDAPHANGKAREQAAWEGSDLIVPLQPNGSESPLFLVHPPGGIVACYQPLAVHIGRERPVFGIRARGFSPGEAMPSQLEEMAAEYVAAVRTVQPEGPYLLGGWSLGGVFAYEMAQQLQELGEPVEFLALLDSTLPFGATNAPYLEGIDQSGREFGLEHTLAELGELAPEDQLPFLWRHVKALDLIDDDGPEELVREIINDLKRLFHAHVALVSDYTVKTYPGRITLFRPSDSPIAATPPLDRGWSQLAEVDVRIVPGQHHTMVKEPHARILAHEMLDCLSESLPRCISSRSF